MREIFIENGINSELIHQVPFGIDTKIVENHTKKTPSQELRIGYIGTLFEHKGVDTLIEAFQLLDTNAKANLTIYGNLNQFPDYGQYLENLVQSHPASRNKIRFAGTFANEKIGQVLENIDILVVPSRWYENTPLVIQTALAAKTPLIATDLGGMSEIIKDGHNGLLFPVNDSQALSKCFQLLMKKPELLQKFAENIAPERTTSDMVDDIEKIYEQVRSKS
jgi:glycosyltransferase involved in cell wall biosynthesis